MENTSSINSYLKTTQIVMGIATILSVIVIIAITAINGCIPVNTMRELELTISVAVISGFCFGGFIIATIGRIFSTTLQETKQEKKPENPVAALVGKSTPSNFARKDR